MPDNLARRLDPRAIHQPHCPALQDIEAKCTCTSRDYGATVRSPAPEANFAIMSGLIITLTLAVQGLREDVAAMQKVLAITQA